MNKTQLATLCYVRRGGKTLMLHRIKKKIDVHKGKWNGLGGKFMAGETPEECVIREVREESGLRLKNPRFRGVLMFPSFTPRTDWMVFVFTADRFSGRLIASSEGHLEWVPNKKLSRLNLWKGDRVFLKWLWKPLFFSAKFIYKNKQYKGHTARFYK